MAQKSNQKSIKHAIIDKDNTTIIVAVSIAVFIVVFSGFAVKALFSQSLFQQRVIKEKKTALQILKNNKSAVDDLKKSYESFEGEAINVLGGAPDGQGPRDGDNAKLVLDALPSEYDYPGLSSSLEKVLIDGGYTIANIGGEEDAIQQPLDGGSGATPLPASAEQIPILIPYPFTIESTPENILTLLTLLESSIRPFNIQSLEVESSGQNLTTTIGLQTYYLPATGLQITTKEVK